MKKMIAEVWISLEHHQVQSEVSGDELSEIFEFELNSLGPHHQHQMLKMLKMLSTPEVWLELELVEVKLIDKSPETASKRYLKF